MGVRSIQNQCWRLMQRACLIESSHSDSLGENSFLPHPSCPGCVCLPKISSVSQAKPLESHLRIVSTSLSSQEGPLWVCFIFFFIARTETWNMLVSSGRHLGSLTHHQALFWSLCAASTGIVYSQTPSSGLEFQLSSFSVHIFTFLFQRNKNVPWSLRTNFPVWASWEHGFWVHTVRDLALTKQLLNKDNDNDHHYIT